jgi:hypothetical protein
MKNNNSKRDFLQSLRKAASDLGDISEKKILKAVREYRSGRKLQKVAAGTRSKKARRGNLWVTGGVRSPTAICHLRSNGVIQLHHTVREGTGGNQFERDIPMARSD